MLSLASIGEVLALPVLLLLITRCAVGCCHVSCCVRCSYLIYHLPIRQMCNGTLLARPLLASRGKIQLHSQSSQLVSGIVNLIFISFYGYIYNFMCCTKPNLYLTREIDPQRWVTGVFGINMLVYIIFMSCWWYYLLWNLVCKFLILEYIANSSFHRNPTNRNNS